MRLVDLPGLTGFLETSPIGADPIWRRPAAQVNEQALQLFYARCQAANARAAGVEAIDRAQAVAIMAAFNEPALSLQLHGLVLHTPPDDPYFVDEFIDSLVKLRPARRRACLFALEIQQDPQSVANLTFDAARQMHQLPRLCGEILTAQMKTRHIRMPYVFWEWATEKIAAPLLKLQWNIEHTFDCSWPVLVNRYRGMINVNRTAEATSFLELVDEVAGGRL